MNPTECRCGHAAMEHTRDFGDEDEQCEQCACRDYRSRGYK